MSHEASAHAGQVAGHGAGHAAEGHDHGTRRTYLIGFVLSVLLTAIPFSLVMTGAGSPQLIAATITALAVVQIVVHMIYFLHMNPRAEGGWNLLALLFTLILVVITLSGSLWVMYHLNTNMMPGHMNMSELP
jgi:cytochrome o ubiquinol oxidase operon protein cyoD